MWLITGSNQQHGRSLVEAVVKIAPDGLKGMYKRKNSSDAGSHFTQEYALGRRALNVEICKESAR
jgi:hypothetical protein